MALTRSMLKTMGIEQEKIDEIISAHSDTVNGLKADIEKYKGDAEKLPTVIKERDDFKAQLDGENPFEKKYKDLKADFDKYKGDVEAKETKRNKEKAYRELLKSANVDEKRYSSIIKLASLDELELDENGKFKNEDNVLNSIKSEWSDFIVTTSKKGANTENPPANNGAKKTKEEILAIKDTVARQKAMAENFELFE